MTDSEEKGKELYLSLDDEEKAIIRSCKDAVSIRTYILYIGLIEKSYSEIQYALSRKKRALERLTSGEASKESSFIEQAVEKVKTEYPNINQKNL